MTLRKYPNLLTKFLLSAATIVTLSACGSLPYRCPLDAKDGKPDSPTACAGMKDALDAAKQGRGGKHSVLVDDKGRIVPPEVTNKVSLTVINNEPYHEPSGTPQYIAPKVHQVWTPAYVDGKGNLHDGRTSYFTTKGEWRYGSLDGAYTEGNHVGESLFRPGSPNDLPKGRILDKEELTPKKVTTGQAAGKQAPSDKVALQNLSDAAQRAASDQTNTVKSAQSAPGVTSPSVQLAD